MGVAHNLTTRMPVDGWNMPSIENEEQKFPKVVSMFLNKFC